MKTVQMVLLLLALAACGGKGSEENGSPSGSATADGGPQAVVVPVGCGGLLPAAVVTIADFKYLPQAAIIQRGEYVRWVNTDIVPHTVTSGSPIDSDAGVLFDSGTLYPGESVCFQFITAVNFTYFCRIHPEIMRDALILVQ